MVETAINQMNDRMREKPAVAAPTFPHLFMTQSSQPQPPTPPPLVVPPQVRPQPAEVIVDSKVLDKELSEELKELDMSVEEPEGRVDADQEKNEPPATE